MIRSMTAFARQTLETDICTLTWELKSVNHRFSEVSLRLPEEFRQLESKIRELCAAYVKRGKLDAVLRFQLTESSSGGTDIDQVQLRALAGLTEQVRALVPNAAAVNPIEILKWPGVLKTPQMDFEQLQAQALALLETALQELAETRCREGEKLKTAIVERCDALEQHVELVKNRLPTALENMRLRLLERIKELKADLDENRVEQEMALLLSKSDVAEEMDRLAAHISEGRRVLKQKEPGGRRLDFLMQELNRESNTLSSKSGDVEITRCAVELKVLIEQMREQVQNIE